MSKQTKKSGLIGVMVGAVAGVIAGVFALAPKGAKENREDLKKSAAKLKADTEKQLRQVQAELESQINDINAKYKQTRGKARDEWQEWVKRGEETLNKVASALNSTDSKDTPETVLDRTKAFIKEVGDKLNEEDANDKTKSKKR